MGNYTEIFVNVDLKPETPEEILAVLRTMCGDENQAPLDSRGTISKNQDWRGGMDKWRDSTGHRAANATPPEFQTELLRLALLANIPNHQRARTENTPQ